MNARRTLKLLKTQFGDAFYSAGVDDLKNRYYDLHLHVTDDPPDFSNDDDADALGRIEEAYASMLTRAVQRAAKKFCESAQKALTLEALKARVGDAFYEAGLVRVEVDLPAVYNYCTSPRPDSKDEDDRRDLGWMDKHAVNIVRRAVTSAILDYLSDNPSNDGGPRKVQPLGSFLKVALRRAAPKCERCEKGGHECEARKPRAVSCMRCATQKMKCSFAQTKHAVDCDPPRPSASRVSKATSGKKRARDEDELIAPEPQRARQRFDTYFPEP